MSNVGMTPSIKEKLGQIIKLNRIKCNITQSQMAVQINCDQSVVSRIEKGSKHINDSIYLSALREFNMNYITDNQFERKITRLISTFISYYECEAYEPLLELEHEISRNYASCKNILLTYELYILEAVLYDIKGESEECRTLLDEVEPVIKVCRKDIQKLYTILICKRAYNKRSLELMRESVETFLESNEELSEDPLLNYWQGVYYFLKNRRMRCLRHLHIAYSHYRSNYIVKTTKIRLITGMMLVREHKVDEAIVHFEEILSKGTTEVPNRIKNTIISNLGYCYYLKKSYQTAKLHFNRALTIEDTYDPYFNYYFLLKIYEHLKEDEQYKKIATNIIETQKQSCESTLKKRSVSFHASYLLLTENREVEYYTYIETYIRNQTHYFFERPIQISLLKELLDYYWKHKQYKKYRDLQDEMITCYA